ncbi:hypothetical protein ACA910_016614 [Epithemia clementina (nom. ined.)]
MWIWTPTFSLLHKKIPQRYTTKSYVIQHKYVDHTLKFDCTANPKVTWLAILFDYVVNNVEARLEDRRDGRQPYRKRRPQKVRPRSVCPYYKTRKTKATKRKERLAASAPWDVQAQQDDHYKWLHFQATEYGLNNLFGTFNNLLHWATEGEPKAQDRKPPDPVAQFSAIKQLNFAAFLNRKRAKLTWSKGILRKAFFAAARFSATGNLATSPSPMMTMDKTVDCCKPSAIECPST